MSRYEPDRNEGGALNPEPEYERLEDFRCAKCGAPIERVSISVYIPPFTQVLVACSENCANDLRADIGEDGAA